MYNGGMEGDMPITQEEANKTRPCNARLEGHERTSCGGVPVSIYCTRPLGHDGLHADQRDGQPIEWHPNSYTVFAPRTPSPFPYFPYRKVRDLEIVQRDSRWFWWIKPLTDTAHKWVQAELKGANFVDFPYAWGAFDLLATIKLARQAGLSVHIVCFHEQNFSDEVFELATVDMP